jgi:hypothetical protein
MDCPVCGYVLSAFDIDCPKCAALQKKKAATKAVEAGPQPDSTKKPSDLREILAHALGLKPQLKAALVGAILLVSAAIFFLMRLSTGTAGGFVMHSLRPAGAEGATSASNVGGNAPGSSNLGNAFIGVSELESKPDKFANVTAHFRGIIVDDGSQDVLQQVGMLGGTGPKEVASFVGGDQWDYYVQQAGEFTVAGSLNGYFPINSMDGSHYAKVTPADHTFHYRDYVDIAGTFDTDSNTITATAIKLISHHAGVIQVDAFPKPLANRAGASGRMREGAVSRPPAPPAPHEDNNMMGGS